MILGSLCIHIFYIVMVSIQFKYVNIYKRTNILIKYTHTHTHLKEGEDSSFR